MNWYIDRNGAQRETIFIGYDGTSPRDKYGVKNSTVGCQLTVKRLELRDAGSVICEIVISESALQRNATIVVSGKLCLIILKRK